MTKVIGMLVALAVFAAMPAVAFAGGDNISSGNEQNGEINQGAAGGDASGGGSGGDAGNQGAIIQQNAGRDANAQVNQSQNFGGDTVVRGHHRGHGGHVRGHGGHRGGHVRGHGGGHVRGHGGGVGGGDVHSVTLARTGFDAWVLALVGGIAIAGGLGLLAAQRRGRLSA